MKKQIVLLFLFSMCLFSNGFSIPIEACSNICNYHSSCSLRCWTDVPPPLMERDTAKAAGFWITCGEYGLCVGADEYGSIVPPYSPSVWNAALAKSKNNCYNYAANKMTYDIAQPGWASGKLGFTSTPSCDGVMLGATSDQGITYLSSPGQLESGKTLLAVVVSPGYDYHWYRRDRNHMWSHKPGKGNATNRDNSGNTISNPETADRGIYSDFCGYFATESRDFIHTGSYQNRGLAVISGTFKPARADQESEPTRLPEGLQAEILLFSGMPNPVVRISSEGELATEFKALKDQIQDGSLQRQRFDVGAEKLVPYSRLGYRGILISDPTGKILAKGEQYYLHGRELRVLNQRSQVVSSYDLGSEELEDRIVESAFQAGKIDSQFKDEFE